MENNEIYNKEEYYEKGLSLNDKDYLETLLSHLKDLSKNYVISMTEASNEELYQKYFASFTKISSLQRKAYELLFKLGWFKLEVSNDNKIIQKSTELVNKYNELSNE